MRKIVAGLMSLTLLLAACRQQESWEQASARMAQESAAAKIAIDAINVRYAAFLVGGQADSAAALFKDDGVLMPPNMPAVTGRAAIKDWIAANGFPPGSTMAMTAGAVSRNGPLAIERGTYTYTIPAMGKDPAVSGSGKYLVLWHDVNGTWQIATDIWNEDAPSAPAPTK